MAGPDPTDDPPSPPTSPTADVVLRCDCANCQGRSALVPDGEMSRLASRDPIALHHIVALAHSALANSASVRRQGPWPV